MKLSQAVNLYVRRKQDAGARFNAPAKQCWEFLAFGLADVLSRDLRPTLCVPDVIPE
jgi:hypothetical protein